MQSPIQSLRRPSPPSRWTILVLGVSLLLVSAVLPATARAQDQEPLRLVATTEMLGWLVRELAGANAAVHVLMAGVDPHAYEPSARDIETLSGADLVVTNGLGLEEGMRDILEQIQADGTPIFEAGAHVAVRGDGHDAHADEDPQAEPAEADEHGHEGGDPHLWLDPLAMRDVAVALGPILESTGLEASEAADRLAATLEDLDGEARDILAVVPPEDRRLVTGHESMGYFADRYDLELIGVVVPGLSSQVEVSAGGLAELIETIRTEGAPAIFIDPATPEPLVRAIVDETGTIVVELATEQLPSDGSYLTFIRDIATRVASALEP